MLFIVDIYYNFQKFVDKHVYKFFVIADMYVSKSKIKIL
jgi:hypothetical protein